MRTCRKVSEPLISATSTVTASSRSSSLLGTSEMWLGRTPKRNSPSPTGRRSTFNGKCTKLAKLTSLPAMRPGIRLIGGSLNSSAASTVCGW
ncbi:hypothetical protein D3C87_1762780 [compost metagenome]